MCMLSTFVQLIPIGIAELRVMQHAMQILCSAQSCRCGLQSCVIINLTGDI